MKCPKCHYVSHDYLDACRKCGIDLVTFKQDIGLLVLQSGVLDLSLVLGGAGADELFESVDEEVSMRASDEEFDISLDDYAEHPGVRRAPAGVLRPGRPESGTELTGMDHLTLELDSSDLPPEMTARLRAARVITDEPPTVPMQPPADLGAITLEPPATLDTASLQLDVSHVDLAGLTPTDTPEAARIDAAGAESVAEAVSMVDSSGNLVSLPLQDVVLAEDTSIASIEHASEAVEPTLPIIDLCDAATASAQTDAARPSTPEAPMEATGLVCQGEELSVDDSALAIEADEPSGSARADVVESPLTTLDEPRRETMGLQSSLELDLSTLSEAEATLSDRAVPALNEAPLTSADEVTPRPPSVIEGTPTAAETPPEGLLTSSDMFALENLENSMPPEHLTLELEPPVLPADLALNLPLEAAPTLLPATPDIPETLTSAGLEPALPVVEAATSEDLDDIALPAHLTLELDSPEMASEVSSITLDNPPNDTQSHLSPHDDPADDEEELLLDLDDLELDDDKPA